MWDIPAATAYGGILMTRGGRTLLREPTNHYDHYVWTYAKGRPDSGETLEQAALREVREKTVYDGEAVEQFENPEDQDEPHEALHALCHLLYRSSWEPRRCGHPART